MKNRILVLKLRNIVFFVLFIAFLLILLPLLLMGLDHKKNAIEMNKDKNEEGWSLNNSSVKFDSKTEINLYLTKEDRTIKMNLEEYVMGVVSAEMPASFDIEALKAQAVAARTFALSKILNKCMQAKGGDICDSTHCQVYMNSNERIKTWDSAKSKEYLEKIKKAIKDTENLVITYNNEIIKSPQYFAVSSGKTENSWEVFASKEPYLVSVDSPGEEQAPKFTSVIDIKVKEFISKVNNNVKDARLSTSNLKSAVKILTRSEGGAVKEIKLGNKTISGVQFRTLFALNSANFTLNYGKDSISISCKGYGHGVGMSQWGANSMAKAGKNYMEIIKHYYSGTEVKNLQNYINLFTY